MKILALDSSAKTASAAITDGEQLISEAFVNAGLTHSETLLPMVDSVLSLARLTMADIDGCVITDGSRFVYWYKNRYRRREGACNAQ